MHMLRSDSPIFNKFGEIYFSCTHPGVVKAWHLHKEMTLNYAVIFGEIKFVLYHIEQFVQFRRRIEGFLMSNFFVKFQMFVFKNLLRFLVFEWVDWTSLTLFDPFKYSQQSGFHLIKNELVHVFLTLLFYVHVSNYMIMSVVFSWLPRIPARLNARHKQNNHFNLNNN